MGKRRCVMCATEFEAKRQAARYCSDRCRQRAKRAGAAAPAVPVVETPQPVVESAGTSGAAARQWLTSRNVESACEPAAADLLVVADSIDAAVSAGMVQYVAALARQAAALRIEIDQREAERQRIAEEEQIDDDEDGDDDGAWDEEAV